MLQHIRYCFFVLSVHVSANKWGQLFFFFQEWSALHAPGGAPIFWVSIYKFCIFCFCWCVVVVLHRQTLAKKHQFVQIAMAFFTAWNISQKPAARLYATAPCTHGREHAALWQRLRLFKNRPGVACCVSAVYYYFIYSLKRILKWGDLAKTLFGW